eukprot:scaffold44995_cov160-Amphora_coffeaeformis.AAC.1
MSLPLTIDSQSASLRTLGLFGVDGNTENSRARRGKGLHLFGRQVLFQNIGWYDDGFFLLDHHVTKTCGRNQCQVLVHLHGPGYAPGVQFRRGTYLVGQSSFEDNVGYTKMSPRFEDAHNFAKDSRLVGYQIQNTIAHHHIDTVVG